MKRTTKRTRLLGGGVSLLAIVIAAPSFAQTAGPAAPDSSTLDELVVTARRRALDNATEIKRNADTVVDSIVADEAGKLPDTSITEVLQRIPGVTMSRFQSLGSPDQFSWEGTGVQIRGLSGITGMLNGREIFSANGGSGLNWGDVTPELMAAVNVYKATTSDLIEGGTGGAIDLRTHMPFDYNKPQLDVSMSATYGDFIKKASPAGSILVTKRWDTNIGEFGALLDLASTRYRSADSFIRTEPYYPSTFNGKTVYVPGGFNYGNDDFDRKRKGIYAAFQWRPVPELTLWQTDFISKYNTKVGGGGVFMDSSGPQDVVSGEFDADGVFQRGVLRGSNAGGYSPGNSNNQNPGKSWTADYSGGFTLEAADNFQVSGAVQVVNSKNQNRSYGLGVGSASIPEISFDTAGDVPTPKLSTTAPLLDAAQANINNLVYNQTHNSGRMTAANLDLQYDIGDGFFRQLKVGARIADRSENDSFTGTYWSATGRGWNGVPQSTVATSPAEDFYVYDFPDFFKGKRDAPGPYIFASPGAATPENLLRYTACGPQLAMRCSTDPTSADYNATRTLYGDPVNLNFGNAPNAVLTKVETRSAYAMLRFGSDGLGALPAFTGNIGARVVRNEISSTGTFTFSGGTEFYRTLADAQASLAQVGGLDNVAAYRLANGQMPLTYQTVSSSTTRSETNRYTRVLPSLNLTFKPDDAWVVRVALNKTLSPPSYNDIRSTGSGGVSTSANPLNGTSSSGENISLPTIFNGYTYSSGNTKLKPAVSTNADFSVEWYPKAGTTAHIDVFAKNIKDLIIYNDINTPAATLFGSSPPLIVSNGALVTLPGNVSGQANYNATETSKIRGVELGGRSYFDQLPGALRGLGLEANFTYIDSKSPSTRARDMNGAPITDLPIVGLSKYNYNVNLLYDYGRWSARLAYNWRSRYLATTTGNGTTNSYTAANGASVSYALPVYVADMGQLDGSVSYKLNDHAQLSADFTNLLNVISRTEMEILPGKVVTRSWFINDRRVSASLRLSF
ncbi:TonB-dependent receptor [Caulobacter sp. UNC279MFTsu5.1]|uniref:TonB-dependent receptor n=1 Tax=Caulobacter sp. UNC279MFTsu5.1 TaxID=1502775 RepID=UPI00035CE35F|nr:TonB-dependent receptor [Caulobacter sp. UNC279MFTsu5.1]SFK04562.1 TonB-dependent receptor [Caulobacter sp. UNC279MFTsu5.1]